MSFLTDGLKNVMAGLNTLRDKRSGSTYEEEILDTSQLVAMYRSSAIARKIVDLPAEDSLREWREWNASSDQITKIEAEEKRLQIQAKMLKGSKRGRLFGGSAIFIGTGEKDLMKPLNPKKIGLGGIKYLTVLNRGDLQAGPVELDPREDLYGKPKHYRLSTVGVDTFNIEIHPSRFVISQGDERPDDLRGAALSLNSGWGDPVLTSTLTSIRDFDATVANIASLIFEAKIDVIGIKGFNDGLRSGGKKYEQLVLDRASLTATGKGINGSMLKDVDDTYEQKSASFSNLPDILDRFMLICSAAAKIPLMLLFETMPSGLNSNGEGPLRVYYDRIKVHQTLRMTPEMSILDECLIYSALGSRPDNIFYSWRPLWQPTQKEKAETGKTIVETFKTVSDLDLLPPEAIGKAIVNGLTESGLAPGLEDDVAKWFESAEFKEQQEGAEEGDLAEAVDPEADPEADDDDDGGKKPIDDAAPRSLYVRRNVLNGKQIVEWAKSQGFKTTLDPSDMHVTLAFSRKSVDWMEVGETYGDELEISAGGPRIMEQFGKARVLLFNSHQLKWRHQEMKEAGAQWDHAEYQPHITISYDDESPDLDNVVAYQGRIVLGPEIFEEVNEKWLEGVTEK